MRGGEAGLAEPGSGAGTEPGQQDSGPRPDRRVQQPQPRPGRCPWTLCGFGGVWRGRGVREAGGDRNARDVHVGAEESVQKTLLPGVGSSGPRAAAGERRPAPQRGVLLQ